MVTNKEIFRADESGVALRYPPQSMTRKWLFTPHETLS